MSVDWNKEPFVTHHQLMEMPGWQRQWFERQPKIWRELTANASVLYNCAHPDNRALVMQDLLREASIGR